jgi:hypothetical protein
MARWRASEDKRVDVDWRTRMTDAKRFTEVGVPKTEALLTASVLGLGPSLLANSHGRRVFAIAEAETSIGRPDVLMIRGWVRGLAARKDRGLRLRNPTEARVLASLMRTRASAEGNLAGLTADHYRRVVRDLSGRQWITGNRVATLQPVVDDSLLLEAKVSHWNAGVAQLIRERNLSFRAALVVPDERRRLVERLPLKRHDIGLIGWRPDGSLRTVRVAQRRPIGWAAQFWLGELALRAFEASLV